MALNFPSSPTIGDIYTDTTSGFSYEWDGTVWKSYTPTSVNNILILDDISGSFDGITDTFAITSGGSSIGPINAQQLRIVLGGVIQNPGVDYIISGTNIVFTTPPVAALDFAGISLGRAFALENNIANVYNRQTYTATASQTFFAFASLYTVGFLDVYRNGVKLTAGTDFIATTGTDFTLTVPANLNDEVEAIGYKVSTLVSNNGELTNLYVTGISTLGVTNASNLNVTGILTASTLNVTGILTASTLVSNNGELTNLYVTGISTLGVTNISNLNVTGNVSIAGTLTYEDVTNVDSIGVITARNGIDILSGGISAIGVITATSFVGDGSGLTGAGSTVGIDTTTDATFYPLFTQTTSGTVTSTSVADSKLTFNPSLGKLTATIVNSSSDKNLKKDITTIENALEKVNQLRGVDFTWKETDEKSKGVIAQELQKVFPELVSEDTNGLSINYSGLIGVLIEAIKELSNK